MIGNARIQEPVLSVFPKEGGNQSFTLQTSYPNEDPRITICGIDWITVFCRNSPSNHCNYEVSIYVSSYSGYFQRMGNVYFEFQEETVAVPLTQAGSGPIYASIGVLKPNNSIKMNVNAVKWQSPVPSLS